MHLIYNAINSQYAVKQSLPIYSWGCLNFTLRYSCFSLRSKWGDLEGFNAFNCMKAYSNNAEQYAYYGYDASGERTYKINVNPDILYINAENVSMTYHIDRYMLYPNGYMNVNQAGKYTKHYYADALRIASKIGGNYDNNFCDSVAQIETDYPEYITHRKNEQEFAMKNELDSVTKYNIITSTLLFDAPNECLLHGGFEEEVFYYHPDHLGSTGMVTNKYANITQALLYAPFGEIVNEYNPGWSSNRVPKYSFNAKELDEENGMYYYSARYYAPPTFISRDPLFEKYPSISPYAYCANNPMKYIDPNGEFPWLVIWAAVEIGLAIYDAYDAGTTIADPNASTSDKIISGAGFLIGVMMPGGGYGVTCKMVKNTVYKINGKIIDKASDYYKATKTMKVGERVATHKKMAQEVASKEGWIKNTTLSKKNGRDIFTDKSGNHYSLDTENGHFEVLDKRGKHKGSIDFSGNATKKQDKTGKHDIVL